MRGRATPKTEAVAEAAPAPQSEPEPAAPPRRRSTVREPAPSFGASAPVVTPMPAPQRDLRRMRPRQNRPRPRSEKPRRTGWWAKRLLGGDKG